MEKNARIFVAGGTGLVGSSILRGLTAAGYSDLISNYHQRRPGDASAGAVRWLSLDLTRQSDVEEFFAAHHPEYVFLAAAKVGGILANNTYKADFIYNNISIAAQVISASHESGVKKLINLGSSCIYPKHAPQPMKEEYLLTGSLEPTNEAYAVAKIAAIKLCRYFNEQYGTNFISVMPTNLYGPGDSFDLENSHVLPALIRKFHLAKLLDEGGYDSIKRDFAIHGNGKVETARGTICIGNDSSDADIIAALGHYGITKGSGADQHKGIPQASPTTVSLWGTGNPFREFLYVDDLAQALIMIMERYDAGDVGEFVNIGSGVDFRIKELAGWVSEILSFKGAISYDNLRPDGTEKKLLDISRIKSMGWSAGIDIKEGILRTYNWYRSQVR
jgi:GDP-L-fucose synthase